MDSDVRAQTSVSRIAAAIGAPPRARMLFCLMDGHARTSTELAAAADVTASTASIHLNRLKREGLVTAIAQGKNRFYSLRGPDVARALEGLSVVAGLRRDRFVPTTPSRLRTARTCYDHLAGALGVGLHDRLEALGWLSGGSDARGGDYDLTPEGERALQDAGIDLPATRRLRRRFAFPCLDWSERRFHVGGALGAALLELALKRKWVVQDLDSRAVEVTRLGNREIGARFGLRFGSRSGTSD